MAGALRAALWAKATRAAIALAILCAWTAAGQPAEPCNKAWNTIWAYYKYPNGPSAFVDLNIQTWKKQNPEMNVILVNESNVKQYVPDMPDEFFRMPYDQCKSDIIRAATIYHHGGLYMDTDFLVLKPLGPYLNLLEDNDIISYSDEKTTTSTTCSKTYSSNWHAGKKGNPFSSVWWRNIKKLLTRKCPSGDYQDSVERVCCHEEGAPDKSSNVCHIPWAHVEQLKTPARWAHDHKIDADTIEQPATPVKTYCLNGRRSLTPQLNGELFWMPWDEAKGTTDKSVKKADWQIPNYKTFCKLNLETGNMHCDKVPTPGYTIEARVYEKYFNRPAYHLFSSTHQPKNLWELTKSQVIHANWVLSVLYRKALDIRINDKPHH